MVNWSTIDVIDVRKTPLVYHYQRWEMDWIDNLLSDQKIYFSQPGFLNDPWDCSPYYDSSCVDNEADHQAHVDYFVGAARRQGTSEQKIAATEKIWRSDKELVRRAIDAASDQSFDAISKQYRIYCLTPKPDCQLMWGHYAQAHKGICLGFKTANDVFCSALKVIYSDEYPKLNFSSDSLSENLLPLLVKSKPWEYENEYRLISEENAHAQGQGTLRTDNGFFQVPPDALQSIYVGINTLDTELDKLKALLKKKAPHIVLKKAIKSRNKYQIVFKDIPL